MAVPGDLEGLKTQEKLSVKSVIWVVCNQVFFGIFLKVVLILKQNKSRKI